MVLSDLFSFTPAGWRQRACQVVLCRRVYLVIILGEKGICDWPLLEQRQSDDGKRGGRAEIGFIRMRDWAMGPLYRMTIKFLTCMKIRVLGKNLADGLRE